MSAAPYMQLYVADYLGDTQHLTTEQHGAYLLILMAMWRAGGTLPNDEAKLARIARVTLKRWHLIAPDVMDFFEVEGGELTQNRLRKEIEKAASITQKRILSGRAGGEAKALKSKEQGLANGLRSPKHRARVPEPDSVLEVTTFPQEPRAVRADDGWPSDFKAQFWEAYPHKVGKQAAMLSLERVRKAGTVSWPDLIAGLKAYIASKPVDRPWCNPQTWLNQGRWEDQPAAAGTKAAEVATPDETKARWRRIWAEVDIDRDTPADPANKADWKHVLAYWFRTGRWPCGGPDPRSSQCAIPPHAVEAYQRKFGWIAPKIRAGPDDEEDEEPRRAANG